MSININDFIDNYKIITDDEKKEEYVCEHIINDYVSFATKIAMADAIATSAYWEETDDGSGGKEKNLHVNSPVKYMLTCMAFIKLYTDIEYNSDNILGCFDLLNEYDIFDIIIQNIKVKELKELNMLIQMACDDIISNEYENHAYITKQIYRFGNLIGTSLAPVIANIDSTQIEETIKRIMNT